MIDRRSEQRWSSFSSQVNTKIHENQTGLNLQPPALKLELYPLLHGDNMVIQVEEAKHNEQIKKYMKKSYDHELGLNPRPLAWASSHLSITPQ